jgi:5-methyltetrahydrofolate--homocysteine methyltransferase
MHRRIRRELGVAGAQGKRYSWGYGACPDLDDHAQVFRLLPVGEALGMTLTSAFQLVPEQSTAAMIVHHPEAKYYAVRGTSAAPDSQASAIGHQPSAQTAAGQTAAGQTAGETAA